MAQAAYNALHATFHAAREYLSAPATKSQFLERGMLTPDEFVQAGDHLIHASPTWAWQRGDVARIRPYLPSDKQYLITRRVRCQRRVKSLQDDAAAGADITISNEGSELSGSDAWIEPGGARQAGSAAASSAPATAPGSSSDAGGAAVGAADTDEYEDLSAAMAASAAAPLKPVPAVAAVPAAATADPEDDEYADLSAFVDASLVVHDAGAAAPAVAAASAAPLAGGLRASAARSYDVSITYDNYFRTPRMYLMGFDEGGLPLTPEQMMEDVQQDYANRTAVLEAHPHLEGGAPHISIHPCRHAATMKRILDSMLAASDGAAGGGAASSAGAPEAGSGAPAASAAAAVPPPTVDSYLFTFLKFISSVIPTIECDFTISVETGRRTAM